MTPRLALAGLLIAAAAAYSVRAWQDVTSSREFRLHKVSLDLAEGSGPLTDPMRQDVEGLLRRDRGASLFDPGLVARFGERIRAFPWVESVEAVERAYPDRICALVRIRRPVAAMERRGSEPVLLDETGAPLPVRYYPSRPTGEVPLIRGIGSDRSAPCDAGDGVRIVKDLDKAGVIDLCAVHSVDLSNLGGRRRPGASEIVLHTAAGTEVEWGRPIGSPYTLDEPSCEMKMDGLKEVLERYPGLAGLRRVRLQFRDPGVEPVARAPGS